MRKTDATDRDRKNRTKNRGKAVGVTRLVRTAAAAMSVTMALTGCRGVGNVAAAQQTDANEATAAQRTDANETAAAQQTDANGTAAAQQIEANETAAAQRTDANETAAAQWTDANETAAAQWTDANAMLCTGIDAVMGRGATDKGKNRPDGWELTLASEDWGLSFGEPGTQPVGNASAQDLAWYDAYYVGGDAEKILYLTFDCGYENGNTEPILDALHKHGAPATFFVVGHFLETAPDLAKRMVAEGHAVGNHTYHHLDMPTISDKDTFRQEMDDVADLFREITGEELSCYYRPPQGKCNTANLEMAQEMGYHTIFWSLAYVDWDQDNQPGHAEAMEKLT